MWHVLLTATLRLSQPALHVDGAPTATRLPSSVIVGRSVCGDSTWLITDWPELIEVSRARQTAVVRPIKGFTVTDRVWGLACMSDGTLWTLINPRTLARLGVDGVVAERVGLAMPRLLLFAWVDRLLFMPLPMPVGQPLLATSAPRQTSTTPWPSFAGRDGPSRSSAVARNLISCGIGRGRDLPCWFADERRAIVADGTRATLLSFDTLDEPDVDKEAPIWDVALGGDDTVWLLVNTNAATGSHKAGGRLVLTDRRGNRRAALRLPKPARLLLGASPDRCLLLAVDGTLMEVRM